MPVYFIRHRDGRAPERVEADACRREGAFWVLRTSCLVVNMPRELVVRRLLAKDVELLDGDAQVGDVGVGNP